MSDVQVLISQLQEALGISVPCGSITLNMNESRLSTYDYKVHGKVITPSKRDPYQRRLDNRGGSRQS
jgi:hypothetical protein